MDTQAPGVPGEAAGGDEAPVASGRGGRSLKDMALSMGVLLVPILLLIGVYNFLYNGDHPRPIDPSGTLASARHSAAFPILEPAGLPGSWTVVSSSYQKLADGSTLRLGYVTPDRTGLQLIESDRSVNSLLPAELGSNAQPGDMTLLGDRRWREYPVARDGGQALVLAENGRTVIVTGTASAADLRVLAGSLH
ncbi:MAG: hypothetical protein V7603_2062 [Micromonosporaceae bacterium]